jgi:hypothetical protein
MNDRPFVIFATLLPLLTGCRQDMHDQPAYRPLAKSTFFTDARSARPVVEGTIARGQLRSDRGYYTGRTGQSVVQQLAPSARTQMQQPGARTPPVKPARGGTQTGEIFADSFAPDLVKEFPYAVTRQMLLRGRERFEMFCAPCHGYAGYANGIIVQRGFSPPPSYHIDRLRQAPVGHFFDVMTNGYGAMYRQCTAMRNAFPSTIAGRLPPISALYRQVSPALWPTCRPSAEPPSNKLRNRRLPLPRQGRYGPEPRLHLT